MDQESQPNLGCLGILLRQRDPLDRLLLRYQMVLQVLGILPAQQTQDHQLLPWFLLIQLVLLVQEILMVQWALLDLEDQRPQKVQAVHYSHLALVILVGQDLQRAQQIPLGQMDLGTLHLQWPLLNLLVQMALHCQVDRQAPALQYHQMDQVDQ